MGSSGDSGIDCLDMGHQCFSLLCIQGFVQCIHADVHQGLRQGIRGVEADDTITMVRCPGGRAFPVYPYRFSVFQDLTISCSSIIA